MIRIRRIDKAITGLSGCTVARARSRSIKFWLQRWAFLSSPNDSAVLAHDNGKLVGFFRFREYDKHLCANGTVVDTTYRRDGLAERLWSCSIISFKRRRGFYPKKIEVQTISRGGHALVSRIEAKYPHIRFVRNHEL